MEDLEATYDCYSELVGRLASIHQQLRGEERFLISIGDEATAALLKLTLLPLESAIVDAGKLAVGRRALHSVRA